MGEIFHKDKGSFFCPDCWDNYCHLDLEDQIDETLKEDDEDV